MVVRSAGGLQLGRQTVAALLRAACRVSRVYERQSILLTTNLPVENWTEVLGNERMTGTLLDRITHRVHIIEAIGDSYRLRDTKKRAKRKRGENP